MKRIKKKEKKPPKSFNKLAQIVQDTFDLQAALGLPEVYIMDGDEMTRGRNMPRPDASRMQGILDGSVRVDPLAFRSVMESIGINSKEEYDEFMQDPAAALQAYIETNNL